MKRFVDFSAVGLDVHAFVEDVNAQGAEERDQKVAASALLHLAVEIAGAFQKVDVGKDLLGSVLHAVFGLGELFADGALLMGDVVEAVSQFVDDDVAFCGEIDQPFLLRLELLLLLAKGCLCFTV